MLKAEEDIESRGRDIDIGGPQSPPPYLKDDSNTIRNDNDTNQSNEQANGNNQSTKLANDKSTTNKKSTKRIQFNMSSKIQFIPTNRQGQYNTAFLGTLPGVLKIAEIVCVPNYILSILYF